MTARRRLEPFAEPWWVTALRTGSIALAIGLVAGILQRRLVVVPRVALVAIWFSLGGHFVELAYRNRLGRRIPGRAGAQVPARLAFWFIGGTALYAGAAATHTWMTGRTSLPFPWWAGACGLVAVELIVHVVMYARGAPSFYDGRG